MNITHLSDGHFKKEVLESDLPVLVDFWAPWCGPCKMIAPILEELAKEYDKKIKVGKINIDENQKVASEYGIMSIPTILFFRHGKAVGQIVGAVSKSEFKKKIEANF